LLILAGQSAITLGLATALGDDEGLASSEALAVAESVGAGEALAVVDAVGANVAAALDAAARLLQEVAISAIKPSKTVADSRFITGLTAREGVLFQHTVKGQG
jgi:hypothetical protein